MVNDQASEVLLDGKSGDDAKTQNPLLVFPPAAEAERLAKLTALPPGEAARQEALLAFPPRSEVERLAKLTALPPVEAARRARLLVVGRAATLAHN